MLVGFLMANSVGLIARSWAASSATVEKAAGARRSGRQELGPMRAQGRGAAARVRPLTPRGASGLVRQTQAGQVVEGRGQGGKCLARGPLPKPGQERSHPTPESHCAGCRSAAHASAPPLLASICGLCGAQSLGFGSQGKQRERRLPPCCFWALSSLVANPHGDRAVTGQARHDDARHVTAADMSPEVSSRSIRAVKRNRKPLVRRFAPAPWAVAAPQTSGCPRPLHRRRPPAPAPAPAAAAAPAPAGG